MYAVIFKAKVKAFDQQYNDMASKMRQIAMSDYGCTAFDAVTEGQQEIAISYWPSQEHIARWKNNAEHLVAQEKGQTKWYESYTVEVVEITRSYGHNS